MTNAVLVLGGLAGCLGALLCLASAKLATTRDPVIDRIDACLPQTQCGQCGYPGCRPYAAAIADGQADINQCAPGGDATIIALGRLLDREPRALNPAYGVIAAPTRAVINEDICVGCARCVAACPVDAIVGAAHFMHTVIAAECTGCGLCLPPCPVDCIALEPRR